MPQLAKRYPHSYFSYLTTPPAPAPPVRGERDPSSSSVALQFFLRSEVVFS